MKKILAIAVATAISAPAMADMTIGGSAALGFSKSAAGNYGLQGDDVALTVAGSQTFGETTVTASTGLTVGTKGTVAAENTSFGVSGNFGALSVANISTGEGFGVDALTDVVAGTDAASYTTHESITYTFPAMVEGVTFKINYLDATAKTTVDGDTLENSDKPLSGVDYQLTTAAAGVSLNVRYQPSTERVRLTASTDMGAVSLAAGYEGKPSVSRSSVKAAVALDEVSTATFTFATGKTAKAEQSALNTTEEHSGFSLDYDRDLGSNVALNLSHDSVEGEGSTSAKLSFTF